MDIQKTSGMVLPAQQPVKSPSAPPPPKMAAPSAPPSTMPTPSPIAAAGLPADKLSASILSFARFFSLPLKPELLAEIRRQSLPQAATPASQSETAKAAAAEKMPGAETAAKNRESLALAAAAAESKGVELRPKGLEAFAEAIDPDWQRRQDSEEHERRRRQKKDNAPFKTAPLSASALKEMALESMEQDPLLDILNRLPGKNGQRWVVLPFDFCESGREFKVSLRILLEADGEMPNRAACMALDILAAQGKGESERRWLFVLESQKLSVHLQPELSPKALESFTGDLSRLMDIPSERIFVKNYAKNHIEAFPCESSCGDNLLPSISEVV